MNDHTDNQVNGKANSPSNEQTNQLITKLNSIFEGILGCEFEFKPIDQLDADDIWAKADLTTLKLSNSERPRYFESIRGGHFGFPIDVNGSCAGLAIVKNYSSGDSQRLLMLADLFSFVLESSLQGQEEREKLRIWEDRLRLLSIESNEKSNVIPLRKLRLASVPVSSEDSTVEAFRSDLGLGAGPLMTKPLLIEASESFPFQRLIVELHQLTSRWALLSTNDLPKDIFHSKEKLRELGAITLFIPNLSDLSMESQLKLAEYLSLPNDPESPQVIAAIHESPENLELTQKVLPHLMHLFYNANLHWTEENESPVATIEAKAEETKEVIQTSLRYMDDEIRRLHRVRDNLIPFHHQYFDPDHTTLH